ncbi:MAG: TRAP transporter substrate-binding protein DctP [Alphaproteobacteria bacterium]|nr:TRAP transporter substrate-binding protein DctP [Alphaproteobacteria bacterium]
MNKFNNVCAAVILATVVVATPAFGEAEFTMQIASGTPSAGNVCNNYLDVWADEVKEKSGGRIDWELHCDGTLAKMGDAVNRVQQGVADVAWDLPAAYGARFEALNVIGVPGLYGDPEPASGALWKTYESGALGEISDVKLLWVQAVVNQSLFMRKGLKSYTELDNAKLALGSQIRAAVIEELGGIPVALKVTEYYQAMAKGTVDGMMTTPAAMFDFGIDEHVTEIFSAPFGGGMSFVVMNNDFYNGLPDDLKAIIDETTGYERSKWASAYLRDDDNANLAALEGVTVIQANSKDLMSLQAGIDAGKALYLNGSPERVAYLDALSTALAVELAK